MFLIVYLFIFISFQSRVIVCQNSSIKSYNDYYEEGVTAYLDEKWDECVSNFETANHLYKLALSAIAHCRIKCQNEPFDPLLKRDIEDIQFYERTAKKTLCFLKCKREHYPKVVFYFPSDETSSKLIEDLTSYTYLHICYFHRLQLQEAASAAFTYLVKHPNHKEMRSNLEYYLTLPEVSPMEVTNYEAEEFVPLYFHGMNAYNNEDWEGVIAYMEESLMAYFTSEQRCRVLCEGPFDQGWYPDFTASVSNHFTFCLQCKQKCASKLKMLNGMKGKEILADLYNYLQIAYSKLGRIPEACRCVASYLLVFSSDEAMLKNKKIYLKIADSDAFSPRPEIEHYLLRELYEGKLLEFINREFTKEFNFKKMTHITMESNDIPNDL